MNQHSESPEKWRITVSRAARLKFKINFIDSLMIIHFSTWFIFEKYLTIFIKMENKAYEESNSRAEYYYTVAQETYKIYDSIREENSLSRQNEQLILINDNNAMPIINSVDLETIKNCMLVNFGTNEVCIEGCEHIQCITIKNTLNHLRICNAVNICSTPFCNASKHFLKYFKDDTYQQNIPQNENGLMKLKVGIFGTSPSFNNLRI